MGFRVLIALGAFTTKRPSTVVDGGTLGVSGSIAHAVRACWAAGTDMDAVIMMPAMDQSTPERARDNAQKVLAGLSAADEPSTHALAGRSGQLATVVLVLPCGHEWLKETLHTLLEPGAHSHSLA